MASIEGLGCLKVIKLKTKSSVTVENIEDIIIVGQQSWDTNIGSNCKDIAITLSKSYRVLYVNSPLDRITSIKGYQSFSVKRRISIVRRKKGHLNEVANNLWVFYPSALIESINWITVAKIFNWFNKRNNIRFYKEITKAVNTLGFRNYILFNDSDIFRSFYLKDLLKPRLSIYYSRDNLIATKYWKKHGKRLEPQLIQKSDLCLSNSEYLRDYCATYNIKSYYVGQGCDFQSFKYIDCAKLPLNVTNLNKPVVGYIGALTVARLNIKLLEFLASSIPDVYFVLVGPQDRTFSKSRLQKMSNVIFVPSQPIEVLPTFIDLFDVCINPQSVNALTIGNYPRKIDEYLALGKSVVATRTEAMTLFEDYVALADDRLDFRNKVLNYLVEGKSPNEGKRKAFAYSHSWENSVNQIVKVINIHLKLTGQTR